VRKGAPGKKKEEGPWGVVENSKKGLEGVFFQEHPRFVKVSPFKAKILSKIP
jgi:hypothetical protein